VEDHRFHEIDLLKCISIITVVYIHSISAGLNVTNSAGIFFADFTRFAVPGLFFAAAFLFDKSDASTGQIIKKRLIRILPPYIFCSLCIQFLNLPGLIVKLEDLNIHQFMLNLIFGNTLGIYYFIFVLFYLYAFSLLLRLTPNRWVLAIWMTSFILLALFVKKICPQNLSFFQLLRHPSFHLFSYLTGWVVALYYEKIFSAARKHFAAFFLTFLFLAVVVLIWTRTGGGSFDSSPIFGQFYIYLFMGLLFIVGTKPATHQGVIQKLSDYSYGIYLLHFPVVQGCQLLYPEHSQDFSFPHSLVSWIAGIFVSLLIIAAIKKIAGRGSVYLVGC